LQDGEKMLVAPSEIAAIAAVDQSNARRRRRGGGSEYEDNARIAG
jgi:hypothetical protein